MEILHGPVDNL